jgi:hypothetical protein
VPGCIWRVRGDRGHEGGTRLGCGPDPNRNSALVVRASAAFVEGGIGQIGTGGGRGGRTKRATSWLLAVESGIVETDPQFAVLALGKIISIPAVFADRGRV